MAALRTLATPRFSYLDLLGLAVVIMVPAVLHNGAGWPWWAADLLTVACAVVFWTGVRILSRRLR